MARTKQASKRDRRSKAVPVLGAAGLSLSLASGASASTGAAADVTPQNATQNHEIFLGDEEISDVNLSTFYVFDHENDATTLKDGLKMAYWRRCRCGGCARACRCGWRACGGCGGCGGCCASWGRCRWC